MAPVASGTIPFGEMPTFSGVLISPLPMMSLDLSQSPIQVKSGDTLAILARADIPVGELNDQIRWYLSDNFFEHYDGGFRFQTTSTTSITGGRDMSSDLEFATYVTVPEPSTHWLWLIAIPVLWVRQKLNPGADVRTNR
jgi:hypothetical protein